VDRAGCGATPCIANHAPPPRRCLWSILDTVGRAARPVPSTGDDLGVTRSEPFRVAVGCPRCARAAGVRRRRRPTLRSNRAAIRSWHGTARSRRPRGAGRSDPQEQRPRGPSPKLRTTRSGSDNSGRRQPSQNQPYSHAADGARRPTPGRRSAACRVRVGRSGNHRFRGGHTPQPCRRVHAGHTSIFLNRASAHRSCDGSMRSAPRGRHSGAAPPVLIACATIRCPSGMTKAALL
jgi:hypothetical protein